MITNLSLKNFKAFENETFGLGSLNILTGLNNAGKSSVIQALRLIHERKSLAGFGPLKGFIRSGSSGFCAECTQTSKNGEKKLRCTERTEETTNPDRNGMDCLVSYISADRFGPKNFLPVNSESCPQTVGCYGENIIDLLEHWAGEQIVPDAFVINNVTGIRLAIQEWLRVISPDINFDYHRYEKIDTGITEFNGYRPVHVGFGLSYTLPIIASILIHSAQLVAGELEMVLLLIENPEAHLHPSGQTKMGKMLALAASCGVQIVVETHSDHLLNGVRIAVKEGKLPCTDVKCYFFKTDDASSEPSIVEQLMMDKYGMLDYWPDGFFDETEKNLMQLL